MAKPEITHEAARIAIFRIASDMQPNEVVRVAVALIAGAVAQSDVPEEKIGQAAAEIGDLILTTLRKTGALRALAQSEVKGNA